MEKIEHQEGNTPVAQPSSEEKNLAALRRQSQQYQRELERERAEREAERRELEELRARTKRASSEMEEEDDTDPYVDHKNLKRKLERFEKDMDKKIDQKAEMKARLLLDEERKAQYLHGNPDFNHIMSSDVVQKFAEMHPRLAESIIKMPDNFERQKLVYEAIKSMGLDKPAPQAPSVKDQIEANKRSPYYQPSGVGTAPYQSQGDFSDSGRKAAFEKMQELKRRLRG